MRTQMMSDLLMMRRPMVQILGVSLFIAVFLGGATFAAFIPFLVASNAFAYDELDGWEGFRLTLPVTRDQVVRGRYLGVLVASVAAFVLAVALGAVLGAIGTAVGIDLGQAFLGEGGITDGEGMAVAAAACAAAVLAVLLLMALAMPLFFKFGATKATRVAPAAIVLVFVLVMWLLQNTGTLDAAGPWLSARYAEAAAAGLVPWLAAGIVACVLAVYAVSSQVACAVYRRREF